MNAHDYAERGWLVFPLAPHSKQPNPRYAPSGYKSATTDHALIDSWPDGGNIGIACAPSGLIIIDVDYRNGPDLALVNSLPATHAVGTADGFHLYYRTEQLGPVRGKLGDGIDIKYNGYVVAPPSIHPDGIAYREMDSMEPIELPAGLKSLVLK